MIQIFLMSIKLVIILDAHSSPREIASVAVEHSESSHETVNPIPTSSYDKGRYTYFMLQSCTRSNISCRPGTSEPTLALRLRAARWERRPSAPASQRASQSAERLQHQCESLGCRVPSASPGPILWPRISDNRWPRVGTLPSTAGAELPQD